MPGALYIQLLGDFRLTWEDQVVAQVDTERVQSLLAYLLLHHGAPQARHYVASAFWPDSKEKQALNNLRNLLYLLRLKWPEVDDFIHVDARTLFWKGDAPFKLDVIEFETFLAGAVEAVQRADESAALEALERAVTLYGGDLLPGRYDEWILPERERLHQLYTRALERLVQLLEVKRDYPAAIHYARSQLQADPLREVSYRTLMRLHALDQDRASVLNVYNECVAILARELGLEPEPTTRDLYERLVKTQGNALQEKEKTEDAALPLVGRFKEWKSLRDAWKVSSSGAAQLVTITGEAGIGKTRLVEELLRWAFRQDIGTAIARCYATEGRHAYAPIVEWLRSEVIDVSLKGLHRVWLAEIARLLPELKGEQTEQLKAEPTTESWQRRQLYEAMARALFASGRPLLLVIDDLQWCDQDTLEWIRFLLRYAPDARLLVVGTVRIEEVEANHPLRALLLDLARSNQVMEIVLGPLGAEESVWLASQVAGRALDEAVNDRMYRETEGNPLFIVEGVRAGLYISQRQGEERGQYQSMGLLPHVSAIPPTVHAVMTRRLAQLSAPASTVVAAAAAIGRDFHSEVLERASKLGEEEAASALDELLQRRIIRPLQANTYDFTHDRLREVAYLGITPARRNLLHRRIAESLQVVHSRALDAIANEVAGHYERALMADHAIEWYQRAAQYAGRVYANQEVADVLVRARKLLGAIPPGPERDRIDLSLLLSLGPAQIATRGWAAPEVGRTYREAQRLCKRHGIRDPMFSILWGLWTYHLVRAELREAHARAVELHNLAERDPVPSLTTAAHLALFFVLFHLGEFEAARHHMEQAGASTSLQEHTLQAPFPGANLNVFYHCYASHLLWHLGSPDQALTHADQAEWTARDSPHPLDMAIALNYSAMVHQFRNEARLVRERAVAALSRCRQYGFAYYRAWGTITEGRAHVEEGHLDQGITQMEEGLNDLCATGAVLREPYYLVLLADAYGRAGKTDEGLFLLNRAQETLENSEEGWILSELHRTRGNLLLQTGAFDEAEDSFRQAVDIARNQNGRSPELRAVVSLTRLLNQRGDAAEALTHLEEVTSSFTEGFDTPDLREAKTLLSERA